MLDVMVIKERGKKMLKKMRQNLTDTFVVSIIIFRSFILPEKRVLDQILVILLSTFCLSIPAHKSWIMQVHTSLAIRTCAHRYESSTWQLPTIKKE